MKIYQAKEPKPHQFKNSDVITLTQYLSNITTYHINSLEYHKFKRNAYFSACSSFSTSLTDIILVQAPVFPILRGVKIPVQCRPPKFRQSGISEASCVEGTEFTTSLVCADPPGI